MTIAAEDVRVKYNCNGSLTDFDFTFKIFSEDDLKVILADSTGAETILALTTDFKVEGVNGDFTNGGTVVTVKEVDGTMKDYTYASGYTITIILDVDLEQETDLIYAGPYSSKSVETMSDRLTKIAQQLFETIGRAVSFKKSSSESGVELDDLVAGMYLKVNDAGDGIEMGTSSGGVDGDKISNDAYGASWDGVNTIAPSKNAVYDEIEALGSIVEAGNVISKTIFGGAITISNAEHFIALTGEGDTTDELTGIYADPGFVKVGAIVILTGKAGLDYTIKISAAVNFAIGYEFNFDNENDAITLIHRGSGVWQEFGGRNNAG